MTAVMATVTMPMAEVANVPLPWFGWRCRWVKVEERSKVKLRPAKSGSGAATTASEGGGARWRKLGAEPSYGPWVPRHPLQF
jgi:hypothetical protein